MSDLKGLKLTDHEIWVRIRNEVPQNCGIAAQNNVYHYVREVRDSLITVLKQSQKRWARAQDNVLCLLDDKTELESALAEAYAQFESSQKREREARADRDGEQARAIRAGARALGAETKLTVAEHARDVALERLDDVLLKDRGKTREINTLTKENREALQEVERLRARVPDDAVGYIVRTDVGENVYKYFKPDTER